MKTKKLGGHSYNLTVVSGQVVGNPKKTKESFVAANTTRISTCDQFFLSVENGKQRAFQLWNFDVACMEGHQMTMVTAERRGKKPFYIAAYNATTESAYFEREDLTRIFMGNKAMPLIGFSVAGYILGYLFLSFMGNPPAGAIFFSFFIAAASFAIGIFRMQGNAKRAAQKFITSFNPDEYN